MSDLLGPGGALAGAVAIIVTLWREHLKSVAEIRAARDIALDGWRAQTEATNLVAAEVAALRADRGP